MENDILQHFGLVRTIAGRYSRYVRDPAIDYDDLASEGYIGLIMAVRRFNPSQGYAFSTYAYKMIAGVIKTFLDRTGHPIRFPAHIMTTANQIVKEGLRDEDAATIAKCLNCKESYVRTALDHLYLNQLIYLDTPLDDSDTDHHNMTEVRQDLSTVEVDEFLDTLPLKKRIAVELAMDGYNAVDIARMVGVTHQAIRNRIETVRDKYTEYYGVG